MGDHKGGKRIEPCLLSAKSRAAWDGEAGEGKVSLSRNQGEEHATQAQQGGPGQALTAEWADPDLVGRGWRPVIGRHRVTSGSHQLCKPASSAKRTAWLSGLSSPSPP